MTWISLGLVFAAVGLGVWGISRVFADMASKSGVRKYASTADEAADDTSSIISQEKLAEWRHTAAFLLGAVVALLTIAASPRFFWLAFLTAPIAGVIGYNIPGKVVGAMAERRLSRFEGQFLDALGGLRNGLKSGRSILQCLEGIATDMDPPISDEFSIFLRQHRMGKDITECAELFRKRVPSEDLGLVLTCIQINQKVGGNLSEVLERIEETIRSRVQLRDRVNSLTSQGKFEGLVMSAAPVAIAGLLLLIDRDLMSPMFTDPIGWAAWGAVAVMEAIAFVMIKMITTVEP